MPCLMILVPLEITIGILDDTFRASSHSNALEVVVLVYIAFHWSFLSSVACCQLSWIMLLNNFIFLHIYTYIYLTCYTFQIFVFNFCFMPLNSCKMSTILLIKWMGAATRAHHDLVDVVICHYQLALIDIFWSSFICK